MWINILVIAALIFFFLGTIGAANKINPVAAGLFCLTLAHLLSTQGKA